MSEQNELKRQQEEAARRAAILYQILSNEARERLERIKMVKPERATRLEDYIIQMARVGRIPQGHRVSEQELVQFLEHVQDQEIIASAATSLVSFQRRSYFDDDDDF